MPSSFSSKAAVLSAEGVDEGRLKVRFLRIVGAG